MSAHIAIMVQDSSQGKRSPLKEIREAAGVTQEQLAFHLGVAVSTVRRWESGKNEPSLTREGWITLCNLLGKDFADLPIKLSVAEH